MMFEPNLYTLTEDSQTYGLHRFKDGEVILAVQHSSGDWINLKPATDHHEKYFTAHGQKVAAKRRG